MVMVSSEQRVLSGAEETFIRVDLAACYRLAAHFGWDELVLNHISARVPSEPNHLLLNPLGLTWDEIRASDFVKIDFSGAVVDGPARRLNPAAMALHGGVHAARPDINCVMHLHTNAGIAVSTHPDGLLPLALDGTQFQDEIAYHEFEGITAHDEERESLTSDLGRKSIMFLRNHGTVYCGRTIRDAFFRAFIVEKACQIQIAALSQGITPRRIPDAIVNSVVKEFGPLNTGLTDLVFDAMKRKLDRIDRSYRD
jgi:ribulose-5-phosphate 4-epimerase/fuculose-1-phosphate aldolase